MMIFITDRSDGVAMCLVTAIFKIHALGYTLTW